MPSGKSGQFAILNGTTEGHAKAAEITRTLLRGIFESAHDIKPNDQSEAARKRRSEMTVEGFNNLRFIGRVLIEKSKNPAYEDKNKLVAVTPDQKGWSLSIRCRSRHRWAVWRCEAGGRNNAGFGCGFQQALSGHCSA